MSIDQKPISLFEPRSNSKFRLSIELPHVLIESPKKTGLYENTFPINSLNVFQLNASKILIQPKISELTKIPKLESDNNISSIQLGKCNLNPSRFDKLQNVKVGDYFTYNYSVNQHCKNPYKVIKVLTKSKVEVQEDSDPASKSQLSHRLIITKRSDNLWRPNGEKKIMSSAFEISSRYIYEGPERPLENQS